MKKVLILTIAILLGILILSFLKDMVIKSAVQGAVEVVTGLKLNMRSFNLGVIKTIVGIKELRLFNPQGYPDKIMLDMPEIYVDYDLPAVIKKKIHLQEVRIDLQEFNVVKNEKGELNLDALKVVQAQKTGQRPAEQEKGQAPQIQIDNLELKIGRVIYKDYSQGKTPEVREYNLNINERYKNISDAYSLVKLIIVRALMNTTIAGLVDFDLGALKTTVSGVLGSAQKITTETVVKAQEAAKQATQKAQETAKEAAEKAKEAVKETTESLKKATEGLKGAIKLPFGGESEEQK